MMDHFVAENVMFVASLRHAAATHFTRILKRCTGNVARESEFTQSIKAVAARAYAHRRASKLSEGGAQVGVKGTSMDS